LQQQPKRDVRHHVYYVQNNVQNEVASMQIDVKKKNTSLIVSFCMIYGVNDDEDNKKQCDQQRQYPQRQHEMREK